MTDPHRFVPNRFDDWSPNVDESRNKDCIVRLTTATVSKLEQTLCSAINLFDEILPEFRRHMSADVYHGLAGIALLYLHLAQYNDVLFANDNTYNAMYTSRDHWLSRARSCITDAHARCRSGDERTGPSFIMTSMGVWAIDCALTCMIEGKEGRADVQKAIKNIENEGHTLSANNRRIQTTPDELLYGRAGYLYAAMYADLYAKTIGERLNAEFAIHPIVKIIHKSGKEGNVNGISDAHSKNLKEPPLSYVWHDRSYTGAAHGIASILYVLLDGIRARYVPIGDGLRDDILQSLEYLRTLRMPSGNYCTQVDNPTFARDRLCQWCHGAPGMALLYALAYEVLKEYKYLQLAKEASEFVWQYGLLRKDPSLCHGAAGNGYSFLAVYGITGEKKYLHRAVQFAKHTAQWTKSNLESLGSRRDSIEKISLYEGLAGAVYYIADVIICVRSHHEAALRLGMPGFALPRP